MIEYEDAFYWVAHFSDGSQFFEYSEGGERRSVFAARAIEDQGEKRIVEFDLVPVDPAHPHKGHAVLVPEGATLFFWRTNDRHLNPNTGEQWTTHRLTKVGWEMPVGDETLRSILYIYPDGTTILKDHNE